MGYLQWLDSQRILAVLIALLGRQAVTKCQTLDHSSHARYTASRIKKTE